MTLPTSDGEFDRFIELISKYGSYVPHRDYEELKEHKYQTPRLEEIIQQMRDKKIIKLRQGGEFAWVFDDLGHQIASYGGITKMKAKKESEQTKADDLRTSIIETNDATKLAVKSTLVTEKSIRTTNLFIALTAFISLTTLFSQIKSCDLANEQIYLQKDQIRKEVLQSTSESQVNRRSRLVEQQQNLIDSLTFALIKQTVDK